MRILSLLLFKLLLFKSVCGGSLQEYLFDRQDFIESGDFEYFLNDIVSVDDPCFTADLHTLDGYHQDPQACRRNIIKFFEIKRQVVNVAQYPLE